MPGTLILVRHGQTAHNATRRFQGHEDVPLNDVGEAQAAKLAAHLGVLGVQPGRMYASDLKRAQRTAQVVQGVVGVELHLTPRLREISVGEWEGMARADLEVSDPDGLRCFWEGDEDYCIPGGESPRAVADCIHAFTLAHWPQDGETVVLVFHGLAITALLCRLLGKNYPQEWCSGRLMHDNTGFSVLQVGQAGEVLSSEVALKPHLERFGDLG